MIVTLASAGLAMAQTTPGDSSNSKPASDSIPAEPPTHDGTAPANGLPAAGQPTAPAEMTKDDTPDAVILKELHAANLAEIQEGTLAQQQAAADKVKKYGRMLIKDHTAADQLVAKEAVRLGISLTDTLPPSASDDVAALKAASGAAFDKSFCDAEASGHAKVIADVQAAQKGGVDKGVKKLLGKLLPTLKKHEKEAQRLSIDAMKAS
jgi:putative membrane protein